MSEGKTRRVRVPSHPAVVAWEAWIASEQGVLCESGLPEGKYLTNRLWSAFHAGWAAREARAGGNTPDNEVRR